MNPPSTPRPELHSEEFLQFLMRRQLRLSCLCAASFLIVLLGLPLANYYFPEFMATRIFGFTVSWFFLGIGFFPAVWVISYYFIRRSIALEEIEAASVSSQKTTGDK